MIVFPGSNDDRDAAWALGALGADAHLVWHGESELPRETGAVVLPGGFSYGDYLRCGAIARFSPIMKAVKEAAAKGTLVLGICNGFQILCEAGLLPGALIRNRDLHFICEHRWLRVESVANAFLHTGQTGQLLHIPIAHGEALVRSAPGTTLEVFEQSGHFPHLTEPVRLAQVLAAWQSRDERTPEPPLGPDRAALLALLADLDPVA